MALGGWGERRKRHIFGIYSLHGLAPMRVNFGRLPPAHGHGRVSCPTLPLLWASRWEPGAMSGTDPRSVLPIGVRLHLYRISPGPRHNCLHCALTTSATSVSESSDINSSSFSLAGRWGPSSFGLGAGLFPPLGMRWTLRRDRASCSLAARTPKWSGVAPEVRGVAPSASAHGPGAAFQLVTCGLGLPRSISTPVPSCGRNPSVRRLPSIHILN